MENRPLPSAQHLKSSNQSSKYQGIPGFRATEPEGLRAHSVCPKMNRKSCIIPIFHRSIKPSPTEYYQNCTSYHFAKRFLNFFQSLRVSVFYMATYFCSRWLSSFTKRVLSIFGIVASIWPLRSCSIMIASRSYTIIGYCSILPRYSLPAVTLR
jgi:hypothetical protein